MCPPDDPLDPSIPGRPTVIEPFLTGTDPRTEQLLAHERAARIEAEQAQAQLLDILRDARHIVWDRTVTLVDGEDAWEPMHVDEVAAQAVLPLETGESYPYANAWYAAIPPEERERSRREFLPLLGPRNAILEHEFSCTDRCGQEHWFLERVAIRPVGGNRWHVYGVATDLTDRKLTEGALRESETRYRSLFASMTEGFLLVEAIFDADGTPCDYLILDVNPSFETFMGLPRDAVVGRRRSEVFPNEPPFFLEHYRELLQTGAPSRLEHYHAASKRHLEMSVSQSAPGLFTCVFRDITDRKRMEEERQRQLMALSEAHHRQAQFQTILDHAPVAVYAKDRDGRFILANRRLERLTGRSVESTLGTTDYDWSPVEDADRWRENDLKVLESGTVWEFEETGTDSESRPYVHLSIKFPLTGNSGMPIGICGISTDITERIRVEETLRRSEEQLRAQAEALVEVDRRKDEFIAMLAHELRNPLSPIRSAVEVLRRRESVAPTLARMHDVIDHQVTHMSGLIDGLLDVSRINQGKIVLCRERIDAAAIVRHAVESCQSFMEQRGHRLSVELPMPSLQVDADPVRLEQVLVNLLDNAAKYTPPNGRIVLAVEREGEEAVFRVRDTGVGIAAEFPPHVFDPFVQGDQPIDRSLGGIGVGLSLVKGLVELHGGGVSVHSDGPGNGSEFEFRLPALSGESQGHDPGIREGVPRIAPMRILLVDDNEDAAETLSLLLEMDGHTVRTALDGVSALESIDEFIPRVALLDIGLPGMDGYMVARRLRERYLTGEMRLVALTGYGGEEDRRHAREAGFDAYLTKPIDYGELRRVLATIDNRDTPDDP